MFDALLPERSAEDLIGGIVRVRLGSTEYVLPELPIDATDEWAARVDGGLAGLLGMIDELGDKSGLASVFLRAREWEAELVDALKAYDRSDVLPDHARLRATVTHTQVLFAVMGVWATTASPLGALVVGAIRALPSTSDSTALAPTSGLRETLGSILPTSDVSSPTASSSTRSRTSSSARKSGSSGASKRSASATSSRATRRHTASGTAPSAPPLRQAAASPATPSRLR